MSLCSIFKCWMFQDSLGVVITFVACQMCAMQVVSDLAINLIIITSRRVCLNK